MTCLPSPTRWGALAGIGFTMSPLIAGGAFPGPVDFAAAKIAIFIASLVAGILGVAILWKRPPTSAQWVAVAVAGKDAVATRTYLGPQPCRAVARHVADDARGFDGRTFRGL